MKSIKSLTALLLCCLMILTAPVAAIGQTAVDGVIDTPTAEKSAVLENTVIDVAGVPVDTEVVANAVEEDEYDDGIYTHLDNSSEILFAYDISMEKEDGTEWQPEEGETVTISVDTTSLAVPEGSRVKVLHEHNGEIKPIEGEYKVVDNKISFDTTGFSKFYFYLTFASGDKVFTLGGYDSIYLSELMTSLELEQSITDVVDVVFSNTSYVSVTKEGDDWLLKSVNPFGTEEYLNIYFADGTVLGIKVTDPILYYYLKDTNWEMDTFESNVTSNGTEWEAPTGAVTINKDAIVGATLGTTETDNAKLDVIIYAHPGMAIRFDRYSDFREISSKPISEGSGNSIYSSKPYHVSKDGLWRWVWGQDSSKSDEKGYNYIVLKDDITEVTETNTFYVSLGDRNDTNHDSNSEYVECAIKIVIVPDLKPEPQLLKDALAESKFKDKYVIKQLNVNLYDYDGAAFNAKYSGDHLSFRGSTINANGDYANVKADGFGENGQMNGGGNEGSKMGIVNSKVGADGLPVLAAGTNVDLFSDNEFDGKTVYADVPFDFIYEPATGYYTYSSNLNHAQFDEESYKVNLYHGGLGTTASYALNGQSANYSCGGFYPFVDINDAVYGGGDFLDWDLWEERIIDGYIKASVPYAADLVTSTAEGTTVNNHNGLYVSERFYLPEDKKNENGDDIVYQFTGDDDLWVFIDGELVLDIGGGHFPIDGEINFTDGTVHVRNSAVENGGYYYNNGAGWKAGDYYNDKYEIKGGEFHTLQVFYLERYAGVSNCRMRFNIPIVPTNAVTVSKNLRNQDDEKLTVTPDEEYKFVLYTAAGEDNNIDAKEGCFSALKNAPYTVTGVGAPMDVQYTNPITGEFTLKDGWSATFEGIDIFTEVYAKELDPNEDYNYLGSTVSVDKAAVVDYKYGDKTETKVMKLDEAITFDFRNFIETQPLSIEKEVVGGELGLIDGNQEFEFTLDFTKAIIEDGEGEIVASDKDGEDVSLTDAAPFNLYHGDKLTFAKVPVNMTYTLKETNPDVAVDARNGDGSFDDPIFEHKVGNADSVNTTMEFSELFENAVQTVDGSSEPVENAIKVINQQRFDLNVKKLGISDLDNHDDKGDGFNKEERQSTIYRVVGKRGDEVITDMNITLHGNTESLIKGLPVGEYTVTELTDWAWRYEPAGDSEKSVTIPADAEAEVEYTNVRVIENWLSGDSYAENWWGGDFLRRVFNRTVITTNR